MNCPTCGVEFEYSDCVSTPGATPKEGDGGVCTRCEKWWTIKAGVVVVYEPTAEDLALVVDQWQESVKRFKEFKARRYVN